MLNKSLILALLFCLSSNFLFAGRLLIIGAADVNMREKPTVNSPLVAKLQMGEVAVVIKESDKAEYIAGAGTSDDVGCKEYFWYEIQINGKRGWIFGAFAFHSNENNSENMVREIRSMNSPSKKIEFVNTMSTGRDMCVGIGFFIIYSGALQNNKKVSLVKIVSGKANESYKGYLGLGFNLQIFSAFENSSNKIVLSLGGFAPGDYEGVEVWELTYNKEAAVYDAALKYGSSTK